MTLTTRVLDASKGRDRALDAIKAIALLVVIAGHSLAWHIRPDGTAVNVLEDARGLIVLTWLFQVLPLFFAAGAVSNLASLHRHGPRAYLQARGTRLLAPVVVYATLWTAALLPFGAQSIGRFLAQLLWFAGVYLLVAAAAVVTSRWAAWALIPWLVLIVAVDAVRLTPVAGLGWLNMLLVWGWLHQVGYQVPRLQGDRRAIPTGLLLIAGSVLVAFIGPYSISLISVNGVPGLSNLAPPSVVLALFGAGQILLVAGLWPSLQRLFSHDRLWVPVALLGARGMGMYLWHIPLVGIAAATAIALGFHAPPLSPAWWLVHLLVVALVLPAAWLVAGVVAVPQRWLQQLRSPVCAPAIGCAVGGFFVLNTAATGFGTWWGSGAAGLPSAAWMNLALVALGFALTSPSALPRPRSN